MVNILKRTRKMCRSEAGLALPIVLVLLLFGGLLVAPTLAFMSTGLKTGIVIEERTEGYYAADAGIEDAYWRLSQPTAPTFPYVLNAINGMQVTVAEAKPREDGTGVTTYYIKSAATLKGKTKGEVFAEIEVRLAGEGGWGFEGNAITSRGTVIIKPGAVVDGSVQVPKEENLDNKGTIKGDIIFRMPPSWPKVDDVSKHYLNQVNTSKPYTKDSITIADLAKNTPLYRVGDLKIEGTGEGTLNGVIYVTGTVTINPKKGSKINLNGHAIYSNKASAQPNDYAINFAPDSELLGSGSIVANGSINFQPNVLGKEDDFVHVMSIVSKVWFKPSGTFYGSAAGDIEVDVWPGFKFYGPRGGPGGIPGFPPGPGYGTVSTVTLKKYTIAE